MKPNCNTLPVSYENVAILVLLSNTKGSSILVSSHDTVLQFHSSEHYIE